MPNPYVNKVVQSNGATLIDISDTTAAAADVASGKYFYLATGEKVEGTGSGGGGGGYDIPTFTITFDSSYSTVLSITCDKTYADCLSIFISGNNTAMSLVTAQGTSDEFYSGITVTATGTGVITYTGYNVAHPAFDIVYNSNGTMSYVEPSAFVDTLNVTVNGTYYADGDKDWTEVNVSVPTGSSGLVFETGTYNPSADTAGEKILFANSHSEAPVFVHMVDATGTADTTSNTNMEFMWYDFYKLYGIGMPWSASAFRYATAFYIYRATNASALTYGAVNCTYNSDVQEASGINLPRFWVDELGFTPNSASTSRYWRAGRTYKWYAVWRDT